MKPLSGDEYSAILSTSELINTSSSSRVVFFKKGSPVIDRVPLGVRGGEDRDVDTGYANGRNSELTWFNMDKLSESEVLVLAVSILEGSTGFVSSAGLNCPLFAFDIKGDGESEAEAWWYSVTAPSQNNELSE